MVLIKRMQFNKIHKNAKILIFKNTNIIRNQLNPNNSTRDIRIEAKQTDVICPLEVFLAITTGSS